MSDFRKYPHPESTNDDYWKSGYHRVSPDDYTGNPWYQDHRTGMFFQFVSNIPENWEPNKDVEQNVAANLQYIEDTYGKSFDEYAKWIERYPCWYQNSDND
jgi:hypothetical protein